MFRCPPFLRYFVLYCCCALSLHYAYSQSGALNGVFAGIEVSLPTVMGQGMDRSDRVILFRPDGTFNVNLRKPDWQTAVTGRYTVAGDKVTLLYTSGSKEFMTLEKDGDLKASGSTGSYGMLKMASFNSVPAGLYKFSNVSSSGGGASGQVFTGTSSNVGLYFDGKGNFRRQSSGATMIAGDDVGGGTSHKDSGNGTYVIQNGVLVLHYGNGKSETHSFFCRPSEKPLMAAINGNIFFMEDAAKGKAGSGKDAVNKPAASSPGTSAAPANAADARAVLLKANKMQGGATLDQIKSMKVSGTASGISIISRMDLVHEKIRLEYWKGSTLSGIEQVNGDAGWQWQNGKKTALSAARIRELKEGLYSGILSLRKPVIERVENATVKQLPDHSISVSGKLDGQDHIFLFNKDAVLSGEAIGSNGSGTVSMFSNFKQVQGVLLPFNERLRVNGQTVQIQYSSYEINPVFKEEEWQER